MPEMQEHFPAMIMDGWYAGPPVFPRAPLTFLWVGNAGAFSGDSFRLVFYFFVEFVM